MRTLHIYLTYGVSIASAGQLITAFSLANALDNKKLLCYQYFKYKESNEQVGRTKKPWQKSQLLPGI